MESPKYTLSIQDYQKWGTNALIFAGPALLVLLASFQQIVPHNSQYGVIALYGLNLVVDLLKKFLDGEVAQTK